MIAKGFHYLVRAAAGAVVAALMFATLANSSAKAATVAEFLANPTQVMAQYPNGGEELASLIRDVAIANPQALATLTSLLSSGSADQQAAVGTGLGQAYNSVLNSNPTYAAQIQAAVGGSSSDSAKTSYSGATGNVATASTSGPGAGGGGGGSGGGSGGTAGGSGTGGTPSGGSNSGSSGTTGTSPTQTSANTFTGGGGGVGGASSSGSVSPR